MHSFKTHIKTNYYFLYFIYSFFPNESTTLIKRYTQKQAKRNLHKTTYEVCGQQLHMLFCLFYISYKIRKNNRHIFMFNHVDTL